MKDCEDDPAATVAAVVVAPVAGLNHSTLSVRELDMAERLTVNVPPFGA